MTPLIIYLSNDVIPFIYIYIYIYMYVYIYGMAYMHICNYIQVMRIMYVGQEPTCFVDVTICLFHLYLSSTMLHVCLR